MIVLVPSARLRFPATLHLLRITFFDLSVRSDCYLQRGERQLTSLSSAALTLLSAVLRGPRCETDTRLAGLAGKSSGIPETSFWTALKPFESSIADLTRYQQTSDLFRHPGPRAPTDAERGDGSKSRVATKQGTHLDQ